jgi:hypothetical protein
LKQRQGSVPPTGSRQRWRDLLYLSADHGDLSVPANSSSNPIFARTHFVSPQNLTEPWEFKILRSAAGRFRDPVWLHSILEGETRAGRTVIEKLDNCRVRLKRLARATDATLGFDPYRTWVASARPGSRWGLRSQYSAAPSRLFS